MLVSGTSGKRLKDLSYDFVYDAASGDTRRLEVLFRALIPLFKMQAKAACRRYEIEADPELIEDLVCDVSVHLLEDNCRRMKVWLADPRAPFEHYVVVVAAHFLINSLGALSNRRNKEVLLDEDIAQDDSDDQQDEGMQDAVRVCLEQLLPEYRQVLVMRYCDGLSSSKIAEQLGETVGSVYRLTHKAKSEMRRLLKQEIGNDIR